jgi:hypothetical protein
MPNRAERQGQRALSMMEDGLRQKSKDVFRQSKGKDSIAPFSNSDSKSFPNLLPSVLWSISEIEIEIEIEIESHCDCNRRIRCPTPHTAAEWPF